MNKNKQNSQQNIKSSQNQKRTQPVQSNSKNAVQGRSASPNTIIGARNSLSRNQNNSSIGNNRDQIASEGSSSLNQKGLRPTQAQQKTSQQVQQQNQQSQSQQQSMKNESTGQMQHFQGVAQGLYSEEYPFDQINNLIHEYLLKNNLIKTLDTFQDELTQPLQPYDQSKGYEFQLMEHFKKGERELFFKKWNRFLPLSILIGDEKVTKLEFYLQIYFFIFPIHPFFNKRAGQINAESINSFKEYLDNRGAALAKTNEFLQYYALPYIPRPQEHQALQHLFTENWIQSLRLQLNQFLASLYDNQPLPLLFYIYQSYWSNISNATNNEGNKNFGSANTFAQLQQQNQINANGQFQNIAMQKAQEQIVINNNNSSSDYIDQSAYLRGQGAGNEANLSALQNENRELVNVVKQFNEKYLMLQNQNRIVSEQNKQIIIESHQKWIATANELVLISKNLKAMIDGNTMKGIPFNQEVLNALQTRIDKFESFLNTNIEDLISQSQDISLFDKQSFLNDPDNGTNSDFLVSPGPLNLIGGQNFQFQAIVHDPLKYENPYCALDFQKIKNLIIRQEDPILCCAVLQALRWRVSKARGAYVRREIVVTYATFNLIGCDNPEDQILQKALFQKDQRIQEFALRLVNAMASDFYGRTYLIKSDNLAIILIDILRSEKEDSFTRRNALGALQKLSLRRKPQIVMINNNLIQWIVKTLRDEKDTLSEYSYEYATALFMNLSLRSSGKLKCEDPKEGVLNVLNDLLEHENMQVRTFVNGTLYSLLGRQSLREQARAMGMNEILTLLMESSDERFTKQIQYIMDQLNKEKPDDDALSDSNEEDNDVDDIDDEEEIGEDEQADDFIENSNNVPLGEDLLVNNYKLEGAEAIKQQNITKRIIQESHNQRMLSSANINVHQSYAGYQRGITDIPFNRPATPSMSTSYISHTQKTSQNYRSQPSQQQQRNTTANKNIKAAISQSVSKDASQKSIIEQQQGFINHQNNNQEIIQQNEQPQEEERNIPSEMRSRPKILRTPAGGERQRIEQLQKQYEQQQHQTFVEQAHTYKDVKKDNKQKPPTGKQSPEKSQSPPTKEQQKQQQQQDQQIEQEQSEPQIEQQQQQQGEVVQDEFKQAFESKPRIPRTPPGLLK
ncbi:hypothetical protein TTHERM_00723450 (macronuclear) [Tetrahymena thermophila SB210]|uniref:LisH domain-containing protein ARMC9 n=1 Tax=Tetrahymena thermophila (strain SB210) TaxID=312017 RepID=I7M641_TETTS|nr:hypothetical protein TTHERM_00723450 [Tetrahymena thermophila SB210]EAR84160.2 hypothetical protein TTHERM_00723450 [Tetrahymena thermophila SB210]|eukprot:XP_001031823.2 hypothetical protein TTHERM_00723450 [Tetrahymena thermophila SB210]